MTQYRQASEQLDLLYDSDTEIGTITYQETLTPQITAEAYHFLVDVIISGKAELKNVRGLIFDFRKVQKFEQGNFQTVRQESRRVNEEMDLSHIPTALLVGSLYQEQMVKVASKISGQEKRLRILYSDDEVATFFAEFHKKRTEEMEKLTPPAKAEAPQQEGPENA